MRNNLLKQFGFQAAIFILTVGPALAQSFGGQLQGQGGSQISAFAHQIVSLVFYAVLVGIIIMGAVVAYKLTHDQRGWENLKNWVFGVAFLFLVDSIVGYFLFAAQNAGLNNQGTLF